MTTKSPDRRPFIDRLEEYYTPDEARKWFFSIHPQLGGISPADAELQGRSEEIHQIIDRLDSDVYL